MMDVPEMRLCKSCLCSSAPLLALHGCVLLSHCPSVYIICMHDLLQLRHAHKHSRQVTSK